jgi:hypothetical protein
MTMEHKEDDASHTPTPSAVWKLGPDSDAEERHIIVTDNGSKEITVIVHNKADADHLVRCVNVHDELVGTLEYLLEQTVEMDLNYGIGLSEDEDDARTRALVAIAKARVDAPSPLTSASRRPIIIEVRGGVVQDVQNVPPGFDYEIIDYDDLEAQEPRQVEESGEAEATSPLPPDPEGMNVSRVAWADQTIKAFQAATGTDDEDALGDLLADLMHWADRSNYDFDAALLRAKDHYEAETLPDVDDGAKGKIPVNEGAAS